MANLTALARTSGALSVNASASGIGNGTAPHFDSILRAAPAYDDDDDDDDGDEGFVEGDDNEGDDRGDAREATRSVAQTIRPHIAHHHSLHAYLDANQMLEETIAESRNRVNESAGQVRKKDAEVVKAQVFLKEAQAQKGKSSMLWTPKKRKAFAATMTKASFELDTATESIQNLKRGLEQERRHLKELEDELKQLRRVEARLDALYTDIFAGPTPEHPEEDEVERKYHILHQTVRRLQASVQQEKRAVQYLDKALKLCESMLKELLKGLNLGIEVGVASNVKHKHQLFVGTGSFVTARASRGSVLRAKTLCGDMHTQYISARGVQRRISALPKMEVFELTRMPDMRRKNAFDEQGLHRALEVSYARAKAVKAHINAERHVCLRRQSLLKDRVREIKNEASLTWLQLRTLRRNIIEHISPVDRVVVAEAGEANIRSARLYDEDRTLAAMLDAHHPFRSGDGVSSERPSISASLPPPYRREFASQSSLGVAFPPTASTPSGTLADMAAQTDWQAREQHRLLTLPNAFKRQIDRESIAKSRMIITRVAVEAGGVVDEDDLDAVGPVDVPDEEDIPGFHLAFT